MEFQLPSVLQKKLTPYDEVRRKVEAAKKKAVRKASRPFHLGLPPLDLLIPNDVLPRNCDKEELIKRISSNELKYRYLDLTYPQEKGYEEEIYDLFLDNKMSIAQLEFMINSWGGKLKTVTLKQLINNYYKNLS